MRLAGGRHALAHDNKAISKCDDDDDDGMKRQRRTLRARGGPMALPFHNSLPP